MAKDVVKDNDTITKYKSKVRKKLGKSSELLDLIFNEKNVYVEDDEIDKFIVPADYIPDVVKEDDSYVLFEVNIPNISNGTIITAYIYFNVYVHKSARMVPFRYGVRTDLIAYEIKQIMNGNDDFGIGRCLLKSETTPKSENDRFYLKTLVYEIKDFDFLCMGNRNG